MIITNDKNCNITILNENLNSLFVNGSLYLTQLNTYPESKVIGSRITKFDDNIIRAYKGAEISYTSSDPEVVEVSLDGTFTAKGQGACEITITQNYLGHIITESIEISTYAVTPVGSYKMSIGETKQVELTDPEIFTLTEDGYVSVYQIDLMQNEGVLTDDPFYTTDGEKIYKNVGSSTEEVTDYQELVEVNNPYLNKSIKDFFSVCYLRKCFISLCQKIFDLQISGQNCFSKNKLDTDLLYKRDLVWALLNTIEYLVEKEQFIEAQRLLQKVMKCGNGICTAEDTGSKGCGCQ